MGLTAGQRVRLVADLGIGEAVAGETPVGFLSLGAGAEGTVERVDGELPEPEGVREYRRLKDLFDDYGHTMPEESRKRLEAQLAALEPEWTAHQAHGPLVTARIRFDNGLVLDAAPEEILTPV
ncbi:hypothetical protein ACIA8O_03115 [Kitasatospora sp. NPDC051853]|uniref:hypothetical protein n=1 Tax=Kitasatospora sp. NPDC051853 TaxID=3364058 RepID=UPI00379B5FBB